MLINLDPGSFEMPNDEVYSVSNNSKGKVFMNGAELECCIYCNVTRGFAVCIKRDLKGKLIVSDGDIIHNLRFGVMTFEPLSMLNDEE